LQEEAKAREKLLLATVEDCEAVKITRNQMMEWLNNPDDHFEEIITGCFARVVD
jgi:hypothetical protein